MANQMDPREEVVKNPLTESSRKARRSVMGLSVVGIVMVKTGLMPKGIDGLGIHFSETDQVYLLFILVVGIVYFLWTFFLYAGADFVSWQLNVRKATVLKWNEGRARMLRHEFGLRPDAGTVSIPEEWSEEKKEDIKYTFARVNETLEDELEKRTRFYGRVASPIGILRGIHDFFVPVLLAVYALKVLVPLT